MANEEAEERNLLAGQENQLARQEADRRELEEKERKEAETNVRRQLEEERKEAEAEKREKVRARARARIVASSGCRSSSPAADPKAKDAWDSWCAVTCNVPQGSRDNCRSPEMTGDAMCVCDVAAEQSETLGQPSADNNAAESRGGRQRLNRARASSSDPVDRKTPRVGSLQPPPTPAERSLSPSDFGEPLPAATSEATRTECDCAWTRKFVRACEGDRDDGTRCWIACCRPGATRRDT